MLEHRWMLDSTVVFSEFMYNPPGEDHGAEWIELYNPLSVQIDLSGWQITGGASYTFPPRARLAPGSFAVVAHDPSSLPDVETAQVFGPLDGRLANGGETVRLLNANQRVMDEVEYDDRGDWPVGPDGSGSSLAKLNLEEGSSNAENWITSPTIGGSPGTINTEELVLEPKNLQLYELPSGGQELWIELFNPTSESRTASDYVLQVEGSVNRRVTLPDAVIGPGQWLLVTADQLNTTATTGDRLFLVDTSGNSVVDSVRLGDRLMGRSGEYAGQWWFPTAETPGRDNEFAFETRIVINEIMYHAAPQYETATQAFAESSTEWIELYNRGETTVDLSGWRLTRGIDFEFAADTRIGPGQYALVVGDRNRLLEEFPELSDVIVGEFAGRLSNEGESLELVDAVGNLADDVHYFDSRNWPAAADGGGSSLELVDPDADNSRAEAWAASWEGDKSQWQSFIYRGVARDPIGTTNPRGFNELILGLLDAGEVLIDDLRVIEDPDGAAISHLQNGSFDQDVLNQPPENWRVVGNHDGSRVDVDPADPTNHVLRLVATSATEHMSNHVETTFMDDAPLDRGADIEVSFRARWLSGSPLLNSRLYFNQAAETVVLAMPGRAGTPGQPNSQRQENLGPTFDQFRHAPLIPTAEDPVSVSARQDPDGVKSMTLLYAINGATFQSVPMVPDTDGNFTAVIPTQRNGRTVQFYIEAIDGLVQQVRFPRQAPTRVLSIALVREQRQRTLNRFV